MLCLNLLLIFIVVIRGSPPLSGIHLVCSVAGFPVDIYVILIANAGKPCKSRN